MSYVRFGSKADMCSAQPDVRFVPIADMSRRAFDPRINFAAQHLKIDWFGEKRLGPALQCLALGLRIAVRCDHDNWHVGSNCLSLWQQLQTGHPRHVDV